jgi:hypothetical protein
MDQHAPASAATVSNLVPVWEDPGGGGHYEPAAAVEAVEHAVLVQQVEPPASPVARPRLMSPPERFDPAEPVERRSAYGLLDDHEQTWAEANDQELDENLPSVDYDALRRRDIARELLRARLIALAERRERRTAYELVFLMLAASVSVLLAAPPLVQVLLAAHGTQV